MSRIRIEWTSDSHDCETCGPSFAEGAMVYKDDALWIELPAVAHCFDGNNHDSHAVFTKILEELGHEVSA